MNDKIMHIIDLVKMVEEMGYIDCKKENSDDATYESILFYLKFCQSYFLMRQMYKLGDELTNGKDKKEPKGLMNILESKGE